MVVLAVDPGPLTSGYALWDADARRVMESGSDTPNDELRTIILPAALGLLTAVPGSQFAIERVACYGRPVGDPVFETVFFSGRLAEWWETATGVPAIRRTFSDVALHFCHSRHAKESHVRQVLLDRFGGKGTTARPGPFYSVSGHAWSAAALGIYVMDTMQGAPTLTGSGATTGSTTRPYQLEG